MAITFEAVYENGVIRPVQPLPFREHERVRVAVETISSPLMRAYGIMGFTGTAEEADRFALDAEFDTEAE